MCLCSVPTPEKVLSSLYTLLKPGGQILVFEHVASDHPFTKFVQTVYTEGGWRWVMDGCELNRSTGRYLLESGKGPGKKGWKEVDLANSPGKGWWSIVPHLVGKLVKAT
jgi:ubiquinone/menaquinone biosynthesis C-methylase UbiE